ncbi:uncharacterized protein LOC134275908 [Saccostrea cucullata]|uniref:uncharacterized protein LOC134275908 n=1 Tax=Saccostrea cuccullata TaxID=36930 RepID=UPI002ED13691
MDWLLQPTTGTKNSTLVHDEAIIIAHNFKGYDGQFILNYLVHSAPLKPNVIMNGNKILYMEICGLKFIDSYNFLPFTLAKMPSAFGFDELKKGYFPHFFNMEQNQNYVGPYPPAAFYKPDEMSISGRQAFFEWYEQQTGKVFDFQKEFVEYCISDVDILRRCCAQFRTTLKSLVKVDPFQESITFASAANLAYRRQFMPKETIAIIPNLGYHYIVRKGHEIRGRLFLIPLRVETQTFPVGHPEIITDEFQDVRSYFGLIHCRVLPPRGLYHPVLPYRTGGKLLFPLCRTCAERQDSTSQHRCQHTDQERSLTGTWVTTELHKALDMGYTLERIHEVWHFEESSQELFKEYINTFLKIKQEASGFPPDCKTPEQQQDYIRQVLDKKGILMDILSIEKNPVRRTIAKLFLNCLWGKFAQRLLLPKTRYLDEEEEQQLLQDSTLDIKGIQ